MSKFNDRFDQIDVSDELKDKVKTRIIRDKNRTAQQNLIASQQNYGVSKVKRPMQKRMIAIVAIAVVIVLAAVVALPSYIMINNSNVNSRYADLEKEIERQSAKLNKLEEENLEYKNQLKEKEDENLEYKNQLKEKEDRIAELEKLDHANRILIHADRILIVEKNTGESSKLKAIISDDYDVDIKNIAAAPDTMEALAEYGQIILMNIANANMPQGFDQLLHSYVNRYGGGLLTVGGDKIAVNVSGQEVKVQNAYDKNDMRGTRFQQMLPVDCIDYTPPIALMIVIDCSGSMNEIISSTSKTRLESVKEGAQEAIDALSERDYVGVISFNSTSKEELELTSVTEKAKILSAIENIQTAEGGTVYRETIQKAGRTLQGFNGVERKHIMFFSDGAPSDSPDSFYPLIEEFYDRDGITMSTWGIEDDTNSAAVLRRMADLGHGTFNCFDSKIVLTVIDDMTKLMSKAYSPKPFNAKIKDQTPEVEGIIEADIPEIGGFYGAKVKTAAEVSLIHPYGAPIYARWEFGQGRVGSIMTDLKGTEDSWSYMLMKDLVGIMLINNIIKGISPRNP